MPATTRAAHSTVAAGVGEGVDVAVAVGVGLAAVGVGDAETVGAHAEKTSETTSRRINAPAERTARRA
jgi:hypothetical protein